MQMNRLPLFECIVGSKLYGTNLPQSDDDFAGIFLPNLDDLYGMRTPPEEFKLNNKVSDGAKNQAGDVDRKFVSFKRFLTMVSQGQSLQTEMLFVPDSHIIFKSGDWNTLKEKIIKFGVSKKSVQPFIGFCIAQAHKSTVKIDNLRKIWSLIRTFEEYPTMTKIPLWQLMSPKDDTTVMIGETELTVVLDEKGLPMLSIAGRHFHTSVSGLFMKKALDIMASKYGERAKSSATYPVDRKSLVHAYRMIFEAEELLSTGRITLPLNDDKRAFLMEIRAGKRDDDDHFFILHQAADDIRDAAKTSNLPDSPDLESLNQLCIEYLQSIV
jgi:hypothetical protein